MRISGDNNNDNDYKEYHRLKKSLTTFILSTGRFFGALVSSDFASWIGRRITIIAGCAVFIIGVILQTASTFLVS
jgi:MFS family permease